MSRIPSGSHHPAPMYYQQQPPLHPGGQVAPTAQMPIQANYVDPVYGSYRQQQQAPPAAAAPPQSQQQYHQHESYNAVAGPSRDSYPYSVSRNVSGDSRAASYSRGIPSKADEAAGAKQPPANASAEASASGAAGSGSGSGSQPGPSEFIKKLYKMLEDESAQFGRGKPAGAPRSKGERGSVGWGRGGSSFVVWDMNEFTTKILPQTFRHSNFSSFVRQLNKYGFSKIKHVDDETGQIKENVWEFQHPNFQAGGKADLDSIKRKAVVPKKGGAAAAAAAADDEAGSPAAVRGLTQEDASRIMDLEGRMAGLEEALYKSQEALRDGRIRENSLMGVLREVVGHLVANEKESGSTADTESAGRIRRLLQVYDQAAGGGAHSMAHQQYGNGPGQSYPPQYGAAAAAAAPSMAYGSSLPFPSVSRYHPVAPLQPGIGTTLPPPPQVSPRPDAVRQAAIMSPRPQPASQSVQGRRDQTLYNGESVTMAPVYSESASWMGDGAVNGAKASDGASLRFPADAAGTQPQGKPPAQDSKSAAAAAAAAVASANANAAAAGTAEAAAAAAAAATATATAATQQSPFGTLIIPQQQGNGVTIPRRNTIKPSWTQTPRILVVEDDVVCRQLTSKFLEKFGCIVDTVENAQQGIEKMNLAKYDLVLMDIFLGPSMDGRKATSLIRQFDIYTPIISMTSNVQSQDVDSYIQSGMNDVLAKPFTKQGLFLILDKHLIHLKAIQLSGEVPRFLGVPPLSDEGVMDALSTTAATWDPASGVDSIGNPLAGSGWSDETYQLVLQQFLATGTVPEPTTLIAGDGNGGVTMGVIGTSVVFPENGLAGRKRSSEAAEDEWEEQRKRPATGSLTEMA